ncbi:MAG: hypothetical protein ACXVCO_19355 [Ktedonobacterales bacterium]
MHIQPLYLMTVIVLWLIAYHVAYWIVAIVRDPSLICWGVGPFGITIVSLRQPPRRQVVSQLAIAAAVLACLAYTSLYLITPQPIPGLSRTLTVQAIVVAIPVVLVTLARLIGILRDLRSPLWGEARVLTGVQRSLATGARIYFTPVGRAFLRERFGATPHEFLRMVRY